MFATLLVSVLVVLGSAEARCHDDAGQRPHLVADSSGHVELRGERSVAVEPELDRSGDERLAPFTAAAARSALARGAVGAAPALLVTWTPASSAARLTPGASRAPPA
jgi:hypothetical protein